MDSTPAIWAISTTTEYLFYVDRIKDMVRRGGENISPIEVERVLLGSAEILDAAVVGKTDPVLGERVIAAVQFAR